MRTHLKHTLVSVLIVASFLPSVVIAEDTTVAKMTAGEPFEQDIVMTAYYSPLPDQCCYVKGSYDADRVLNGNGTHGADGTPVYTGMIAAPKSYSFGTRLKIPGLGVLSVHDRGGAIIEQGDSHRIDVWVGSGEEGLARALAFGVRRVRATVYPPLSAQPAEAFSLEALAAPLGVLRSFLAMEPSLVSVHPSLGQKGPSVTLLQESLQKAGYLAVAPTGFYGPTTRDALAAFQRDAGIEAPADTLTDEAGAYLQAYVERAPAKAPIAPTLDRSSAKSDIARAQRTLRFLGYYRGRTNGVFDDRLYSAILAFQKDHQLVGDEQSPGAGRIGPKASAAILMLWRRAHTEKRAERILLANRVLRLLAERKEIPQRFLGRGEKGDDVRTLQRFLVTRGLLDATKVTGLFGEVTEAALRSYQLSANVIKMPSDPGAGYLGPATLASLRAQRQRDMLALVRARGWSAL